MLFGKIFLFIISNLSLLFWINAVQTGSNILDTEHDSTVRGTLTATTFSGNLTGNVTGNTQGIHTGAVNLGDDVIASFGNSSDLIIEHDTSQAVDLNMIKTTLEKKITKINEEMKKIDTRLSNKSFMDRAPQNIVDQEKSNFANLEKDVKKIELTLKGL